MTARKILTNNYSKYKLSPLLCGTIPRKVTTVVTLQRAVSRTFRLLPAQAVIRRILIARLDMALLYCSTKKLSSYVSEHE